VSPRVGKQAFAVGENVRNRGFLRSGAPAKGWKSGAIFGIVLLSLIMDKNSLIQLTSNLYRLTLLFPKKEPLRFKMRELADEILANFIKSERSNPSTKIIPEILKDIEVLDSFFEISRAQNWVSPQDILKVEQQYNILKEELEKLLELRFPKIKKTETGAQKKEKGIKISTRQQKILEILRQRGKAQVKDLKEILPEMSKRTLRRDFEKLLNQGLIERIGDKQDTFYKLRQN